MRSSSWAVRNALCDYLLKCCESGLRYLFALGPGSFFLYFGESWVGEGLGWGINKHSCGRQQKIVAYFMFAPGAFLGTTDQSRSSVKISRQEICMTGGAGGRRKWL